jgi:hypothetical protein
MADSLREGVVQAFDTRLKEILTAGGYETDAGTNVEGWKDTPHDIASLPALVWRDTDLKEPEAGATDVHNLTIEIDAVVVKTSTVSAMAQLRKLIADVVKVLGTDLTLGALAQDIRQLGEEIQVDHEDKKIMTATLLFDVIFTSGHFDPYA